MNRRDFLKASTIAGAGLAIPGCAIHEISKKSSLAADPTKGPIVISTWKAGQEVSLKAYETMASGGSVIDAVEAGARLPEADPGNASVGYGGNPNRDGVVQLDAAIMDGNTLNAGSVAGVTDIKHPISVARLVMDETPHVMLVGNGARQFAIEKGFPDENLLTPRAEKAWERWKEKQQAEKITEENHDTMGTVGLDGKGNMAAACTTSGASWKLPGRVGDSPIIGAGVYCDSEAGGASATGLGEEVIKVCGCYQIVEFMRQGYSPTDAINELIGRLVRRTPKNQNRLLAFVALRADGAYGFGSTTKNFKAAVAQNGKVELFHSPVTTVDLAGIR